VIEFCERPGIREFTLFALLNKALEAIKSENLVVLINKAPDDSYPEDAREFYDQCCYNLRSEDCKLPKLTDSNFLFLARKGRNQKLL
jgi:hypothetical protein